MAVRGAVHLLFHCPAVTAFVRHSVTASQQGGVWPATGGGVVVWWCGGVECKV